MPRREPTMRASAFAVPRLLPPLMASARACVCVQLTPATSAAAGRTPPTSPGVCAADGSLVLRLPLETTMAEVLGLLRQALHLPGPVRGSVVDTGRACDAPVVLLYAPAPVASPLLLPTSPYGLPDVRRPRAASYFAGGSSPPPRHRVSLTRTRPGKRFQVDAPSAEPECAAPDAHYVVAPPTATLVEVCEATGALGSPSGLAGPAAEPTLRILYAPETRFGGSGGHSAVGQFLAALKRWSGKTYDRDEHRRPRSPTPPTRWATTLKRKLTTTVTIAGTSAQRSRSALRSPSPVPGHACCTSPASGDPSAASPEEDAATPRSNASTQTECQGFDNEDVATDFTNPLTITHTATFADKDERTSSGDLSAPTPPPDFDFLTFTSLPFHVQTVAKAMDAEAAVIAPTNAAPPQRRLAATPEWDGGYPVFSELVVSPPAAREAPTEEHAKAGARPMLMPISAPVENTAAVTGQDAAHSPNTVAETRTASKVGHGTFVSVLPQVPKFPSSPRSPGPARFPGGILIVNSAFARRPSQRTNVVKARAATPDGLDISPLECEQSSTESINSADGS